MCTAYSHCFPRGEFKSKRQDRWWEDRSLLLWEWREWYAHHPGMEDGPCWHFLSTFQWLSCHLHCTRGCLGLFLGGGDGEVTLFFLVERREYLVEREPGWRIRRLWLLVWTLVLATTYLELPFTLSTPKCSNWQTGKGVLSPTCVSEYPSDMATSPLTSSYSIHCQGCALGIRTWWYDILFH